MVDRKKFESLREIEKIEKTFSSPKENQDWSVLPLSWQYVMDRETKDFDPSTSMVGLIVSVESQDAALDGILSRNENVFAIYIPYASVLTMILENPKVTNFETCDSEVIELLRDTEPDEITLKLPWSGPEGDEWDSPAYSDFWGAVEQNYNRKIKTLERVGKTVKVV